MPTITLKSQTKTLLEVKLGPREEVLTNSETAETKASGGKVKTLGTNSNRE